uniref:Genome polyprotein n=1 Tax=Rattus tanezumi parechovirus TaxID=2184405 RepID=A0A2S1YF77_9PICO|nr:polyprotein [Rattus tanezumi parechovirus]
MAALMEKAVDATLEKVVENVTGNQAEQGSAGPPPILPEDRVQATTTVNASNLVQNPVAPTMPVKADFKNTDDFLSMSYQTGTAAANPTKLVVLGNAQWESTHNRTHEVFRIQLPTAFWANDSMPAYGQSQYFTGVRCGFHFQVQLNVNLGTAGALIIVYMPRTVMTNFNTYTFNSFTNLPHIIMNAATTTQADLYIPYTNHHNFARVNTDDLGYLLGFVWSAMTVPTGSPTTIDITIMGSLLNLEFQGPRPFGSANFTLVDEAGDAKSKPKKKNSKFKWVREKIDIAEGPGTMNLANVLCTTGSQSVALVGERAYYDPRTAGTKARLKDFISIAQMFSVSGNDQSTTSNNASTATGYMEWSATQTPGTALRTYSIWMEDFPNLRLFSSCYNYFRGSIVMKIDVFASSFNRGRLRMCAYPNINSATSSQLNNAVYTVCDIGENNSFELTVPFSWSNWMRHTRGPPICDISISVLNRLTYNSSSPNSVNVLFSVRLGDDAKFFVPTGSTHVWQGLSSWGSLMDLECPLDNPEKIMDASDNPVDNSNNIEVTTQPEGTSALGLRAAENSGSVGEQFNTSQPMFLNFVKQNVDIYTVSHTKVDHIMGRAWRVDSYNYSTNNMLSFVISFPKKTHAALTQFMAYFCGEVNFHIVHTSASNSFLEVCHTYVGDREGVERVNSSNMSSSGSIIIPPNEQMSFCVPYYSPTPLRCVKTTQSNKISGLGTLFVRPIGTTTFDGRLEIFCSLRCPNFFFPVPAPKLATSRSVEESLRICHDSEIIQAAAAAEQPDEPLQITERIVNPLESLYIRAEKWFKNRPETVATFRNESPDCSLIVQCNCCKILISVKDTGTKFFLEADGTIKELSPLCPVDRPWINTALMMLDRRMGYRSRILCQCGDVEENPGPWFEVPVLSSTVLIHFTNLTYKFYLKTVTGEIEPLSICEERDRNYIFFAIKWFNKRSGYRSRLLSQCGDVEENPGPIELVYKPRGFYKHYGVRTENGVYHLDSDDILKTAFNGEAIFRRDEDDGNWQVAFSADLDYFTEKYLNSMVGTKHIFSAQTNCETIARDIFPGKPQITQSKALAIVGTTLLSAGLLSLLAVPFDESCLKVVYNQSLDGDSGGLTMLVQRCMTFFSNAMVETLNNDIVRFIIKVLVRLLCYIVLYCHAPNMLTTVCLGTLLVMDITASEVLSSGTKALFQSMVDGDVGRLVSTISENLYYTTDPKEQIEDMKSTVRFANDVVDIQLSKLSNQGPVKDFNEISMSFRHIEWWISVFKRIFAALKGIFAPSSEQKAVKWLNERSEAISQILGEASEVLVIMKDPTKARQKDNISRYLSILEAMKKLVAMCVKVAPSTRFSSTIFRMYSELLKVNVKTATNTQLTRMEPVGIWITGNPGQGKSFLTHALATKLLKKNGFVGIYTNPTGSEFMDGYCGQDIHIIDDAGQNREEKDLALLCQCISSVPFSVPMASLDEKGMFYTSKVVIATTNKSDFTSTVLSDSGALSRRFPYRFSIRAAKSYCKAGKLFVPNAMGAMADGSCWEFSLNGRDWSPMNLDQLVDDISADIKQRQDALALWRRKLSLTNEGCFEDMEDTLAALEARFSNLASAIQSEMGKTADELIDAIEDMLSPLDTPFQCFERAQPLFSQKTTCQKIHDWVKTQSSKLLQFCEQNKGWIMFFSLLTSFLGILAIVYSFYKDASKPTESQRAYNPQTANSKKGGKPKFETTYANFKNEAPFDGELEHIFAQSAFITAETNHNVVHCAAYRENAIILHGHSAPFLHCEDGIKFHFKNAVFDVDSGKVAHVTINDQKMDLILLKVDHLPICFKNYSKYYTNEIGTDNMLVWTTPKGRMAMPVECVSPGGPITTAEGTQTTHTYNYKVKSKKGMCGGLLVTRVKGAFKILGMHIAGNGQIGVSAAMGFLQNDNNFKNEGIISQVKKAVGLVHQPTKTKLNPSPVHDVVPVNMQPAVLSPRDLRLLEPMESVVKSAAQKYRVNVFNVDQDLWMSVLDQVKEKFRSTLGIQTHTTVEVAVCGGTEMNSLDLSTSPGLKYVQMGFTKRDLIQTDPFWLHPLLATDVKKILDDVYTGKKPWTVFAAHLKDELRKLAKIQQGKTRCIEACAVDYVIAYRVIMHNFYEKIYQTMPQQLGIAVGMNPWQDWHFMMESLYQYNYGLDYSAYDGSLSDELMRYGVEVMAYCHTNPEQVMILHEPVINSVHHVLDEIWFVDGGMPSGSPCTTVLNSVCNVLVCAYTAKVLDPECDVLPITYGDDVIFSVDRPLDMEKFCEIVKNSFGMEVTGSTKDGPPKLLDFEQIDFLKRTTKFFPGTRFMVGALLEETLMQHIMWMKNLDTFKDQLMSFENELCLHGEDKFNEIKNKLQPYLMKWNCCMNDFDVVKRRMISFVFN